VYDSKTSHAKTNGMAFLDYICKIELTYKFSVGTPILNMLKGEHYHDG